MGKKQKAKHPDEGALDPEEEEEGSDPADEADADLDDEEGDDEDDGEDDGEGDAGGKSKKKTKPTEVERLRSELAQEKKNRAAEARKRRLAEARIRKLSGSDDDDDPETPSETSKRDVEKDREIERLRTVVRKTQVEKAVASYLGDKHPDYILSATDIALNVREAEELEGEDAILENHRFDKELLDEVVEREAKRFVRRNPRAGKGELSGGEGSPPRNGRGGKLPGGNDAAAAQKRFQDVNTRFGGVLDRI